MHRVRANDVADGAKRVELRTRLRLERRGCEDPDTAGAQLDCGGAPADGYEAETREGPSGDRFSLHLAAEMLEKAHLENVQTPVDTCG